MRLRTRLLLSLKLFQIWLQRQGRRETIMTGMHVTLIRSQAQAGDILLSYEDQRATSKFIRGEFDHAAIITDKMTVMEAVGDFWVPIIGAQKETFLEKISRILFDKVNKNKMANLGGVREVDLDEWLWKKDHVVLIRPVMSCPIINTIAAKNAYKYKGFGYDYGFEMGGETVFCSELEYSCYYPADNSFMDHLPADKEILPIQYLEACSLFPKKYKVLHNTRG